MISLAFWSLLRNNTNFKDIFKTQPKTFEDGPLKTLLLRPSVILCCISTNTYVKRNFGKGKTWKQRGLIVSHVNYDGLVRRLFVVLCVHEVRAMVQQEDSSSICLLKTSRKSKHTRYFLSQLKILGQFFCDSLHCC